MQHIITPRVDRNEQPKCERKVTYCKIHERDDVIILSSGLQITSEYYVEE